ncbi:hypothetical protein AB0D49_25580 [Streptomyces sp. NPDC048290]|uniref:hypothetical protein n=1 Tax=Streptomyces sp. NPDC048290 TaxID=3155811 RepID=UPI0034234431
MRRAMTMLGTLAVTAGAMALALPSPAYAAHGRFVLNSQLFTNPSGCIEARSRPLSLQNQTNEYALVYDRPHCTGKVLAVVAPGGRTNQPSGSSVYVA